MALRKTIVGQIDPKVLTFTVGRDAELDLLLAEWDCIGTAAHVTMLSQIENGRHFTPTARDKVIAQLLVVMRRVRRGGFTIRPEDQDIHLAVERALTARLGDIGGRVHTGRSRNDQAATDLRLYGKDRLLCIMTAALALARALIVLGRRHADVPMAGRTHMQPAMPGSVGLWFSCYAEALLDDMPVLRAAYDMNDKCPLGSAAGFGVPLGIKPAVTARLLGFREPFGNALNAANARGKCEAFLLTAAAQVMLTLSRLAEDLIIYAMPEFGYFVLPPEFGTGSSIMPQKNNPDVLELVRAKAVVVSGHAATAGTIVARLPGGYNRDVQEVKPLFMEGLATALASLEIVAQLVSRVRVDRKALAAGFTSGVFATDRALELVSQGLPFRQAYAEVKKHLDTLAGSDPVAALRKKKHTGAPGALDFDAFMKRQQDALKQVARDRRKFYRAISALLQVQYPELG